MKRRTAIVMAAVVASALVAGTVTAQMKGSWRRGEDRAALPEIKAVLMAPPAVPPALDRQRPARVVVELTTTEEKGTLANGVEYSG